MIQEWTLETIAERLSPLLSAPTPETWRLVLETFRDCVFGKILPPEAPLRYPWVYPGGYYRAFWVWDTQFVADLIAILPDTQEMLRTMYRNYRWYSQCRLSFLFHGDSVRQVVLPCPEKTGQAT